MSSTTQKHRNFVSEPIGSKLVTNLPGVGQVYAERLAARGYEKASSVLGQYLVMGGDKEAFQSWMSETARVKPKDSLACYNSLKEWSDNNM